MQFHKMYNEQDATEQKEAAPAAAAPTEVRTARQH